MPQSLSRIEVHLVFSTKNRVPTLGPGIRSDAHAYMAGILRDEGMRVVAIGGVADHVHLLFELSRTLTIAQVVEKLKVSSSKWAKTHPHGHRDFAWQSGYGVFSVSADRSPVVARYIAEQESHHAQGTFLDELRDLFREHGISFDERYVWD